MNSNFEVLKMAYRKHVLGDDAIGWDELGDTLKDALCEIMGDEAFVAWIEGVKSKND